MDARIQALLDDADKRPVQKRQARIRGENQPALIAIKSSDADVVGEDTFWNNIRPGPFNPQTNQNAFSQFNVKLPRPVLNAKELQLMSASIPQSNAKLPETALVFYYYRLSKYSGSVPSQNNLWCVRLLPSFYKPEYFDSQIYGSNKSFGNYRALAAELVKSCASDILWDNIHTLNSDFYYDENYKYLAMRVPFLPNDISITYNADINKFQMTGQNDQVAYLDWSASVANVVGDVVVRGQEVGYGPKSYECVRANLGLAPDSDTFPDFNEDNPYVVGNVAEYAGIVYQCFLNLTGDAPYPTPNTDPTHWAIVLNATIQTFWKRVWVDIVAKWESGQYYEKDQYVRDRASEVAPYKLFKARQANQNHQPVGDESDIYWLEFDEASVQWYEYISAGYEDPIVRDAMGAGFVEWNATTLYSKQKTQNIPYYVKHKGFIFASIQASIGNEPFAGKDWGFGTLYAPGDIMNFGPDNVLYKSLNPYEALGDWDDATYYSTTQRITNGGAYYEAQLPSRNVEPTSTLLNDWVPTTEYETGDWVLYKEGFKSASVSDVIGVGGQVSYTTGGTMPFEIGDVVSVSGLSDPAFNLTGTITFANPETGNFQFPSAVVGSLTGQTGLAVSNPPNTQSIGYRCIQPTQGGVLPVWNYESYNAGDYVSATDFMDPYGGGTFTTYKCIANTTGIDPNVYPIFTNANSYVVGSRVKYRVNVFDGPYNFIAYESNGVGSGGALGTPPLTPSNPPNPNWTRLDTNLPPSQAPSQWEVATEVVALTPDNDPTHWLSYGDYLSARTIWKPLIGNIGNQPPNATWWEEQTSDALLFSVWSGDETYDQGGLVSYEGVPYQSLVNGNSGNTPTSGPFWLKLREQLAWLKETAPVPYAGLNQLTTMYDMVQNIDGEVIAQYPYGISGQPCVSEPKRLLNTILGFTWNGIYKPEDFVVVYPAEDEPPINLNAISQKALPLIYNRMRPIPRYVFGRTPELADEVITSQSLTYTAESFCNLVFSSVVSIYSNLIGSSTLDSANNTKLLAMVDMNAQALGVGYWAPTLECPIKCELDSIYGIQIELRDEYDEPYFLPNNANAVLTFKVSYK